MAAILKNLVMSINEIVWKSLKNATLSIAPMEGCRKIHLKLELDRKSAS